MDYANDGRLALVGVGIGLVILFVAYRFFRHGSERVEGEFKDKKASLGQTLKQVQGGEAAGGVEMKVIQDKCPQCNTPLQTKVRDHLFFCEQCNTMHIRNGGAEKLDYEIAEFNASAQGERLYMPFWRVYATFNVHSKSVEGGTLFKLAQWVKGASNTGNMFIYVPASELDNAGFRSLSTRFTANRCRRRT